MPDRTGDYVAAVLEALRLRWRAPKRRDELVLAAARRSAARRRDEVYRDELNPRHARRDRLAAEITEYEGLAEALHCLATEPNIT
ncbi:hypothetical protein ACFO1B_14300 [Dactylosporangium siamense]|uniref:Uncharacterized protein n=1 Tax=Dactylosporangium siamense TaxID=685454 RepID=A0A919PMV3_9ACTN|nr:hypothetical protein [Dactylosporangium siamense]GIG45003.1 hypothetical protein Dsi01nite_030440 [Dactylosporangium siamense]